MVKDSNQGCEDKKCPFHGQLKIRKKRLKGRVVSALARHTARIRWERKHRLPKYERYETRITSVQAHNPPCINAQKGDIVLLVECRPLSKTKHFVIVNKSSPEEEKKAEEEKETKENEKKKQTEQEKRTSETKKKETEKKNQSGKTKEK